MKVVFVNRFFHPDLAPAGLAAGIRNLRAMGALGRWREVIAEAGDPGQK